MKGNILGLNQQFRTWRDSGVWERIGKMLREQGRKAKGRKVTPSVAIIDSQTVKTALKGGGAVTMRVRKSRAASATSR
jgi:transposase